jgi:hypothetical protein
MIIRLSLLAACVALPAYAASSFDGQYHGTLSRDPGGYNAGSCSQGANILMTVEDGKLQYNHFQNAVLNAPVAPDGSFTAKAESRRAPGRSAGSATIVLNGRITGTTIAATVKVESQCNYALSLRKG